MTARAKRSDEPYPVPVDFDLGRVAGLVVAILGGAAVGVERQHSGHATGPNARLGGIRTFTLLGTLAGLAGLLIQSAMAVPAALLLAGAVLLIVAGYIRASRGDIDATTEVAAVVVLAAGVLGGLGELRLSAAITTLTVLVLAEKPRLHGFVARLDEPTMLAAARFAVMSVVILPLLPEGPYGPGPGIRPRELWMLVLLFSGMSFMGYIAQRMSRGGGLPADRTARRAGVVDQRDADVCAAQQIASKAGRPARHRRGGGEHGAVSARRRGRGRAECDGITGACAIPGGAVCRRAWWHCSWRGDRFAARRSSRPS